jgi:hypothetical protein
MFVTAGKWIFGAVSGAFDAIRAYLSPVMTGIANFISANWQTAVGATAGYLTGIYNLVSSVFTAAWGIVSTIGSALVSAWTWTMQTFGIQTADTGSTVGNVFQTIMDATAWLVDGLGMAFTAAGYAITHWRDVLALAGTEAALSIVTVGAQIAHTFTDVIPAVLSWFAGNWQDVFTTIASFTAAVFTNLLTNAANFGTALWAALKGDGFNFDWTPLTTGFENTIKELPKIAERQAGPLEAALQGQADSLRGALGEGIGKALAGQEQQAKKAAGGITAGIGAALAGMPAVTLPFEKAMDESAFFNDPMKAAGSGAPAGAAAGSPAAKFADAFQSGAAESLRARFAMNVPAAAKVAEQQGKEQIKQQTKTNEKLDAAVGSLATIATNSAAAETVADF